MTSALPETGLPLMLAAMTARRSRERMLRLICAGEVEARRERGFWYVNRESLDRLLEREGRAPVAENTMTPAA